MSNSLDALNDDILIYIFIALSIPEILLLRQASRRLYLVSEEHSVWKTVCTNEILKNGIPFPQRPLTSFSAKDLERQTLRAYRLGCNLQSPTTTLHHVVSSSGRNGAIAQIKFLSHRRRTWLITTSIGIWWTLCVRDCDSLQVVAQWSPAKTLFNGLAVNTDDQSEAAIAMSVHTDGCTTIKIIGISEDGATIRPCKTLDTSSRPVALSGDVVALCDHDSETLLLNWKTEEQALLKSPNTWQDKPLHVVFAHRSIFVVRARSICVFDEPKMVLPGDDLEIVLPRVFKSFGWVDDPWRPTEQFQFMTYKPEFDRDSRQASHDISADEPESSPFNPIATLSFPHRGPLRCSDMVLGSYGSGVWIQPSDWAAGGLTTDNIVEVLPSATSRETLVVALFPGSLNRGSLEAQVKVVLENPGDGWSCLDYDEVKGLIALGSSSGEVILYRL